MSSNTIMVKDEKGMYHCVRIGPSDSPAARRLRAFKIAMGNDPDSMIATRLPAVPSAAAPVAASKFIQNNKTVINVTQNITQNIKIVKKRR